MSNGMFYLIFTPIVFLLFAYAIYAEKCFRKVKEKAGLK